MREEARVGAAAAAASQAARLLLPLVLALLGGAGHVGGASVCDTANCGKGNCSETPGLLPPGYECHCDPGWSHALKHFPFSPCIIPNCSFDSACLNLSLAPPPRLAIPDVCSVVSCGDGGACKAGGAGAPFSYSCECQPGYANLINNVTALPCVNCYLGSECYALGLGAPPPARPAPAPSGDDGPSEPSAPPSGTGGNATHDSLGSVSSPSLVQLLLLLLVSVATVQVV